MDETRILSVAERLTVLAAVTGGDLYLEASTAIHDLLRENADLKDRLWSSDRLSHATDPWEAEDA